MENIQKIVAENDILKSYMELPKEELQLMRMYFILELIGFNNQKTENLMSFKIINSCLYGNYNYLQYILNCKYGIDTDISTMEYSLKSADKKCLHCDLNECINYKITTFIREIYNINKNHNEKIAYI